MVMPEVPSAVIVKDLVVVSSKVPELPLRPSPLSSHGMPPHALGCLHSLPSWLTPGLQPLHAQVPPTAPPQTCHSSSSTPQPHQACHPPPPVITGGASSRAPPSVAHLTASQLGPVHSTSQNPESASSPPPPQPPRRALPSGYLLSPSPSPSQQPFLHTAPMGSSADSMATHATPGHFGGSPQPSLCSCLVRS